MVIERFHETALLVTVSICTSEPTTAPCFLGSNEIVISHSPAYLPFGYDFLLASTAEVTVGRGTNHNMRPEEFYQLEGVKECSDRLHVCL